MKTAADRFPALTLSIFAGAFVFGTVMSSLGSLLPALFGAIGFEKLDAGRLFLFMNLGMLMSSLLFGPICDRFGFRATLLVSTLLIAAAFRVTVGRRQLPHCPPGTGCAGIWGRCAQRGNQCTSQ